MNKITAEWIDKAEEDYIVAVRESKAKPVVVNAVCYHSQQCIEKYLKAYLQDNIIHFPKTHELGKLLSLAVSKDAMMSAYETDFIYIDSFAADIRYPGSSATAENMEKTMKIMKKFRKDIRIKFGL